jgi:hypothetical protein
MEESYQLGLKKQAVARGSAAIIRQVKLDFVASFQLVH